MRARIFRRLLALLAVSGLAVGVCIAAEDYSEVRRQMVLEQIQQRGVSDTRVLAAMRRVPRHLFVPDPERRLAYSDEPVRIGWGQTISQPYIVGLMSSLLEVGPGAKVLEIGTGSGYQAAVLSQMGLRVYTMEIIEPLGKQARSTLSRLGYRSVQVRIGDGYKGWPEQAPFDAILLTAAPPRVPEPLIRQLKVGGRMVLPVGEYWQDLQVLTKQADGSLEKKSIAPVRFVPMTGEVREGRLRKP
ncbi:MAG TPA: protein-L-isoaspartate(D-aspartate) O-methyltransferase [Thermoanaerobaculia bacterium]|nr:protein-L-isoaspartate(D-aspartate) O-methyltransferase [Thermoanaerobaculia bacterium]